MVHYHGSLLLIIQTHSSSFIIKNMSFLVTTGRPAGTLVSSTFAGRVARRLLPTAEWSERRSYAQQLRPRKHPPPGSSQPPPPPPPSSAPDTQQYPFSPKGPPRLVFSPSVVPSLAQFESALNLLENKDLTAQKCVDGAHKYVSVATQYETRWRGTLESSRSLFARLLFIFGGFVLTDDHLPDHSLSPYLLHWLGILTLTFNTAEAWRLGTHILRSASELGYAPSTVTLVRFLHAMRRRPGYDKIQQSILFRSAHASFDRVLKTREDPNAFSLQGSIRLEEGHGDHALRFFREAKKVWAERPDTKSAPPLPTTAVPQVQVSTDGEVVFPTPRAPKWEWEVVSVLGEADIHKVRGQLQKARNLYRVAALELDHPRGFLELARLTNGPRDAVLRRAYLLKAAVSGSVEACRELGGVEETRAQEKGITEREKETRLLMSKEWIRLANGEDYWQGQ